jgi:molecular chaperone GrpE
MTDETRPETLESETEVIPPPSDADESPSSNEERLSELTRERDEYEDLLLRKTAEFDNFRKRVERERQAINESAAVDLITELLPLVDDLERALMSETNNSENVTAYRAGVNLIHKQLLGVLAKHGVSPIDTSGQQFDPHYHEAVAHEVNENHSEGEIIDEVRRGYMSRGRLLRPAMVRVAKA